jgi:hypothetical protein
MSIAKVGSFGTAGTVSTYGFTSKIIEDGVSSNSSLYTVGVNGYGITATNATTSTSGIYTLYTFAANGTFAVTVPTLADVLLVGGGGGGGFGIGTEGGGGGGGGGVGVGKLWFVPGVTYAVTVGAGGTGGWVVSVSSAGYPTEGGSSSVVGGSVNEVAYGGGRGGAIFNSATLGFATDGGSGGGARTSVTYTASPGNAVAGNGLKGAGTLTYYGNRGGKVADNTNTYGTGGCGGGGAGTAGADFDPDPTNAARANGTNGGDGYTWAINGVTYGGGGGGSMNMQFTANKLTWPAGASNGAGGSGGGGAAGINTAAVSGTANRGGGGGASNTSGGVYGPSQAGNGGSGVVVLAVVPAFVLSKFLFTGVLDTTFNGVGFVPLPCTFGTSTNVLGYGESNCDLLAYPNGKLAVGYCASNSTLVSRVSSGGTVEATYTVNTGTAYTNLCMALSPANGNVYLLQSAGSVSTALTQMTYAGTASTVALNNYKPLGAAFDLCGNLFVVGDSNTVYNYLPNGTLNIGATGFNNNGYLTSINNGSRLSSVLVQPDGNVVVSGTYVAANNARSFLMRFTPRGFLDGQFGSSGYTADINTGKGNTYIYSTVYSTATNKLLVVGGNGVSSATGTGGNLLLGRYNFNGTVDSTFNGGALFADATSGVGRSCILSYFTGTLNVVNGGFAVTKYSLSDTFSQLVVNRNTNNYQLSHSPAPLSVQTSIVSNTLTVTVAPPTYTGGAPIRTYTCVTNGKTTTLTGNLLSYAVSNVSSALVSVTAHNGYGGSPAAFGGTAPAAGPTITSVGRDAATGNLVVTYTKPPGYYYPATPTHFYYQLDTSAPNLFTDIGNTGSFSVSASAGKHDVYMNCAYRVNGTAVWTSPASVATEPQYQTNPSTALVYPSVSSASATVTQTSQYFLYEFTTSGNITFPNDTIAPVLVVGGGGGGSAVVYTAGTATPFADVGGGGGAAGQMIFGNVGFRAGTYNVVVGAGGTSNTDGTFSSVSGTGVNVFANGGSAGGSGGALTNSQSLGAAGGTTPTAAAATTGLLDFVSLASAGGAGSAATTGTAGGCGGGGGGAGGSGTAATGTANGGAGGNGFPWPVNGVTYAWGGAGGGGTSPAVSSSGGGSGVGLLNFVGGSAAVAGSGGGGGKTIVPTAVLAGGTGSGGSGANGVVVIAIPKTLYSFNGLNLAHAPGTVMAYLGTADPVGWVICNGSARTATDGRYGMLLAMGIGSGTANNYTPPDYRGAFLRGTGTSSVNASYVGPALNASQLDSLDAHTHTLTDPGHTHVLDIRTAGQEQTQNRLAGYSWDNVSTTYASGPGSGYNSSIMTLLTRSSVRSATTGVTLGSTGGTETRPFNYGVNWILKI